MFKSCDRIVSAVANANITIDNFPRSERVMYQYYYGRYLLNQHRVNEVGCGVFIGIPSLLADTGEIRQ